MPLSQQEFNQKVQNLLRQAEEKGTPPAVVSKFIEDRRAEWMAEQKEERTAGRERQQFTLDDKVININPQTGEIISEYGPEDFSDLEELSNEDIMVEDAVEEAPSIPEAPPVSMPEPEEQKTKEVRGLFPSLFSGAGEFAKNLMAQRREAPGLFGKFLFGPSGGI